MCAASSLCEQAAKLCENTSETFCFLLREWRGISWRRRAPARSIAGFTFKTDTVLHAWLAERVSLFGRAILSKKLGNIGPVQHAGPAQRAAPYVVTSREVGALLNQPINYAHEAETRC